MTRYSVLFRKSEGARYLSHLDLIATLEYAVRRARLPVELSEGYNPRPRLSVASPIALGYVGEREILEMALREELAPGEIQRRLQAAVPPGLAILSVEPIPAGVKPAASRLRAAIYRVHLSGQPPDIGERISAVLSRETLPVNEMRDGKVRTRDLRPMLISIRAEGDGSVLRLEVRLDGSGTVRPEQILELLTIPADDVTVVRERIELVD